MKVARRVRRGDVGKGHSVYLVGVLLYHWAHEKREDGCHSPAEVLGWQKGTMYPETVLDRILFATRYTRFLDKHGFLRFSNWKLYAERGLAHQPVSVWVYEGTLKIEHQAVTLSKYAVELQEDHKHLREVSHARIADTPFRSPQLTLIDVSPDEWILYWRMPVFDSRKYDIHLVRNMSISGETLDR